MTTLAASLVPRAMLRRLAGVSPKQLLLAAMCVAALLRLVVFLAAWHTSGDLDTFYAADTRSYARNAQALIAQGAFLEIDSPEIRRTPAYPVFLIPGLLLGPWEVVTILLQIAASCATVYLVFQCARMMAVQERIAVLAALLYALEPLSIAYCSLLLTETLFAFFLVAFACLWLRHLRDGRWTDLALAAAALSLATYVRPIVLYLPIVAVAFLTAWNWMQGARLRSLTLHAAVFLAVSGVLSGAWIARNAAVAGYAGFSTISLKNLYAFQASAVIAEANHVPFSTELSAEWVRERYQGALPLAFDELHVRADGRRFMLEQSFRMIATYPLQALQVYVLGITRTLAGFGAESLRGLYPMPSLARGDSSAGTGVVAAPATVKQRLTASGQWAFFLLLYGMLCVYYIGTIAAVTDTGAQKAGVLFLLAVAAYLLVLSGGATGYSRFRHPIMPLLAISAAVGLAGLAARFGAGGNVAAQRGGNHPAAEHDGATVRDRANQR